ncbi:hypothetical protein SPRG_00296 [Saprolegnia parasitica CBS 223.65]|uniref:Potassium channel domain-containing protein n=1 Tax=Saprolegnia parasitica (strain CBS 223.65) TaxID=695850 RepID=A0A067CY54_SAPPC|nr:hypothetical protein SPRG_00296 [Saprolegnia parasitica CBS 223.65]KDO35448.1 hypothetical protein SPRG_00296 [Saprolegnia parasitica CBS 223.65]|eukprot:XP_012193788.1 hypothetical protein SPRG_00296 [Saprolegnia parasitica CBS 223.65]
MPVPTNPFRSDGGSRESSVSTSSGDHGTTEDDEVGRRPAIYATTPASLRRIAGDFMQQLQLGALVRKANEQARTAGHSIGIVRISDIEARIGHVALDPIYRRKNLLILLNGLFGLALSLVELVVTWAHSSRIVDPDLGMVPLTVPIASNIIKAVISVSSCLLVLQLIDLYRLFYAELYRWEAKFIEGVRATRPPHEKMVGTAPTLSVVQAASSALRRCLFDTGLLWRGSLEVGLVLVHPPPWADAYVYQSASCLMFFRLYLLARVYRDHSIVYRKRQLILENCFLTSTSPTFNWFLSVKLDFGKAPLQFILALYLFVLATLSTSVHVFERVYQPDAFTFANAVWFSFCTLTTHGLPTMDPISGNGYFVTSIMLVLGIALETMVVVAILHNFGLNEKAGSWRAIWSWWRWKRARHATNAASEENARRFKFWQSLEPFGDCKEEHHQLAQSVGDPIVDKLKQLEATAQRLRRRMDDCLHACTCEYAAADLQAIRDNNAVLDAQREEIALLFARATASLRRPRGATSAE